MSADPHTFRWSGPGARLGVVLLVSLTAGLGGCSGAAQPASPQRSDAADGVTVGADGVQSITLTVGDDFRFSPAEFTVAPGEVSVTVESVAAQLTHSLDFPPGPNQADIGASIPVLAPSVSDTIEFTVDAPGEYAFVCSFHQAQGHTGIMVVTA